MNNQGKERGLFISGHGPSAQPYLKSVVMLDVITRRVVVLNYLFKLKFLIGFRVHFRFWLSSLKADVAASRRAAGDRRRRAPDTGS